MTSADLYTLLPMIIVAGAAIIALIAIGVRRNHSIVFAITLLGLVISFISLPGISPASPEPVGEILTIDHYSLYFMGLMLALSIVTVILSYAYLKAESGHREELYVLMLIAALGGMILAAADHFVSLFLGLEILTVALYVMIGFLRDRPMALEAGVKYLILAAAASAFLVLGMALVYAETGTMKISELLTGAGGGSFGSLYALAGAALVVVGAGFKLGVVPFHMWAPDVYQGAPSPVTGFIASVSKSAMVAFLIRYLWYIDLTGKSELLFIMATIAFLSMVLGNILAIIQSNLKRLLAYSSIAHLGYVLVPLVVGGSLAREAVVFYITVYGLSILGAFGLIAAVSREGEESDAIESWRGMFWRRPLAAAVMSVMMFSLAGIPLTAGFIGKYQVVLAGIEGSLWFLVMTLVVSSVIGLYYYLRVIAVMIDTPEPAAERLAARGFSIGAVTVLTLVGIAVVYLGVYPGPLFELIRTVLTRSFL